MINSSFARAAFQIMLYLDFLPFVRYFLRFARSVLSRNGTFVPIKQKRCVINLVNLHASFQHA